MELHAVYDALRKTRAALLNLMEPYTERYGLGHRGLAVLGAILRGINQPSALAAEFFVGPSLMTVELQRLGKARLITRAPDPADARRVHLQLTHKSEQLLSAAEDALRIAISPVLRAYTAEERVMFLDFLHRLSTVRRPPRV